jgi:hypothetical protein
VNARSRFVLSLHAVAAAALLVFVVDSWLWGSGNPAWCPRCHSRMTGVYVVSPANREHGIRRDCPTCGCVLVDYSPEYGCKLMARLLK